MNSTIFYRLLWKEFRQVRAFAICLLVLGAMIQLALLSLSTRSQVSLWGIATVFPLMFLVGCAATIFSSEHENKSYLSLRMLPISLKQILSAKFTFTIATTLLIAFTLWVIAAFAGEFPSLFDIAVYALIMTEMFVWGTFFSMLDRQPMRAIALTVIAVFGIGIVCSLVSIVLQGASFDAIGVDWLSVVFRLAVLAGVIWLTVRASRAWYQDERVTLPFAAMTDPFGNFSRSHLSAKVSTGQFGSILRIVWLQMRRNVAAMTVVLVGAIVFVYYNTVATRYFVHTDQFPIASSIFGAVTGAMSFAGLSSCRPLLLNRGVRPSKLWLLVTLFGLAFCFVFILALSQFAAVGWRISSEFLLLVLTSFFWGQLSVHAYRRQLAGIGMSIIAGVACYYWLTSMNDLEAPRWVYVYPVAVIPVVATLFGTDRWMKQIKHSRMFGLALFTGIAVLVAMTICRRAYSIPKTNPSKLAGLSSAAVIEVDTFAPAAQKRFTELGDRLIAFALEGEIPVEQSKSIVREMMQLDIDYSLIELSAAPDSLDAKRVLRLSSEVTRQLLIALHTQDVDFAEQILRFSVETDFRGVNFHAHAPTWAELRNNQADRIVSLIELLDEHEQQRFDRLRQQVSIEYSITHRALKPGDAGLHQQYRFRRYDHEAAAVASLGKIAFWEQERSQRALDRNTAKTLEYISWLEENSHRPILREEIAAWELEDMEVVRQRDALGVEPLEFDLSDARHVALDQVRHTGFLKISLAISAWRHDNAGELPATLDDLTPKYLAQSPVDSAPSTIFHYFPDGLVSSIAHITGSRKEREDALSRMGIYNISLTDPFLMCESTWRTDNFQTGDHTPEWTWNDIHCADLYSLQFENESIEDE